MILSTEDKERFMRFLEEDIQSNEGIIEILEKQAEADKPIAMLVKHKKGEVICCKVVHKMLASMTTETIG